jgi:hypothetical protein
VTAHDSAGLLYEKYDPMQRTFASRNEIIPNVNEIFSQGDQRDRLKTVATPFSKRILFKFLRKSAGTREREVVVPVVGGVPVAKRSTQDVLIVAPGPAPDHAEYALLWPGRIMHRRTLVIIIAIPICHPLPNIPSHINTAKRAVAREAVFFDRCGFPDISIKITALLIWKLAAPG